VLTAAANSNNKKENAIRVELQDLLISGPPSRMRKGRSCKVEILFSASNAREKFLIHEANISKTDPMTLLSFSPKIIQQQKWNA